MRRLEFIKEETAESHSSEEGRRRLSYSKNRKKDLKFITKQKRIKPNIQNRVKHVALKNKQD